MGISKIDDYFGLMSNSNISEGEYSLFLIILSKV